MKLEAKLVNLVEIEAELFKERVRIVTKPTHSRHEGCFIMQAVKGLRLIYVCFVSI